MQRRPRVRVALAIAAVAVCGAVVALNGLQIRALSFGKGVDQTYLFESLESTVHGRFFHHTHATTNRGGWGEMDHFWPTMLLFVPLVALIGHQIVLYLINGLCLAATGMVVFALARDSLEDERLAALAALLFWTMPEVYYVAITGCWPEVWAMPWLALLFLCYRRRQPVGFALAALPFMGTMEQMLGYVGLFAVLELLTRREPRWVVLPAALAGSWVVVLALFADSFAAGRFLTHPFSLSLSNLLTYLGSMFLSSDRSPLVYLALLWPPFLLFSLPPSLVIVGWNLDLGLTPAHDGKLRYAFFVFLFMAVGGLEGARVVARVAAKRLARPPATVVAVLLVAVLAAHLVVLARLAPAEQVRYRSDPADDLVWETVRTLPTGARVAANREIPYAFFGRAGAFFGFVENPSLYRVKELYFDERNTPTGAWRGEDKYLAMGRHTPAAFVLERRGTLFAPAKALWADPDVDYRTVGCVDGTGDGRPDVVLSAGGGRTLLFENRPGGRFDLEAKPGAAIEPPRLDGAALRGPGREVQVGEHGWVGLDRDRAAVTLRQLRDGATRPAPFRLGGYVEEVLVADLEGDGGPEVLVLDSQGYRIWVLRPGPGGALEAQGEIAAPPIPTSVAAADLDGDGDLEIVVTKSQLLPDVAALERLLVHERVDHLFWYQEAGHREVAEHFCGRPGWTLDERAGLLCVTQAQPGGGGAADRLR